MLLVVIVIRISLNKIGRNYTLNYFPQPQAQVFHTPHQGGFLGYGISEEQT